MNRKETIWIIGAGHFGRQAATRLSEDGRDRRLVLVDPSEDSLAAGEGPGRTLIQADGATFLARRLRPGAEADLPDWIIPAVPVHLPAEWCLALLGPRQLQRRPIPSDVRSKVPQPLEGPTGDVYVSHARFRCPADCSEPEELCTVTRKPRPRNLFEILGDLRVSPYQTLVVRSQQLGPGIGGYRPAQLFSLLEQVQNTAPHLLMATACRCHGVLTALEYLGDSGNGALTERS